MRPLLSFVQSHLTQAIRNDIDLDIEKNGTSLMYIFLSNDLGISS